MLLIMRPGLRLVFVPPGMDPGESIALVAGALAMDGAHLLLDVGAGVARLGVPAGASYLDHVAVRPDAHWRHARHRGHRDVDAYRLPSILPLQSVNELLPLVDGLALGLLGAGAFIGGIVTTWIGVDLMRLSPIAATWCALCVGGFAVRSSSRRLFSCRFRGTCWRQPFSGLVGASSWGCAVACPAPP